MPNKRNSGKHIHYNISELFYSDVTMGNMLHARLVRSPQASGTIVSIKTPEFPAGYAFFTAKDIPGKNDIKTLGTPTPIFCNTDIHYFGEPIGILTGPDTHIIEKLCDQIEVLIEPPVNPDTITPFAARELSTGLAQTSYAEFQKLFTPAEDSDVKVITNTWTSSLHHPSYGETNGALCEVVNNVFRVYTPTQWPRHLSKTLSEVFSIDKKDIHIEKTRSTNTSINGIWRNAIFVSQAALAALKTGKAVKLSLSRQDQEIFMEHAIPAIISNRCVIQNNGLITAMDISIDLDMGYTNPFAQEIIDRLVIASCGIYNIQNLHIKATAHSSHTPPSSLSIESIDSQAFFAIENQIQKIAEITGLSPDELRKINIKQKASTQYTPFTFHFDYIEKAIDSVCKISDFNRKYVTYRYASLDKMTNTPANTSQTLASRGIGLACGFYGSGYFSSILHTADQYMEVVLEKDESVTIHATTPSKPIQQFWKTIVATQLAISDPNRITINSSFSPDNEPQLPESAYNNLTVMTQLLKKCCLTLNRKRNTQELPITVKKGISPSQRKSWDAQQFTGTPFLATALASAVVDLELDPSTYKQILRGIWVVVDAGKIISAKDAENTIKLDIQRLLAILIKDEIIKCPLIDIRFIQSDAEPKEIRGLMQNVLPAAFTSALSQALANTITDIPLLPKTLFIKGSHS